MHYGGRFTEVIEHTYSQGLVSRTGKKLRVGMMCCLLKNPFYAGLMVRGGVSYHGTHQPLINQELFDRAQELFRQKQRKGKRVSGQLVFLLSRKITCPRCTSLLVGEQHTKPSGKVYRYYRCYQTGCGYAVRVEEVDAKVLEVIGAARLDERLGPLLRRRRREARVVVSRKQEERIRYLRSELRRLEEEKKEVLLRSLRIWTTDEELEAELARVKEARRATEWLLAMAKEETGMASEEENLLELTSHLKKLLRGDDEVKKKQVVDAVVEGVSLRGEFPRITFTPLVRELIPPAPSETPVSNLTLSIQQDN